MYVRDQENSYQISPKSFTQLLDQKRLHQYAGDIIPFAIGAESIGDSKIAVFILANLIGFHGLLGVKGKAEILIGTKEDTQVFINQLQQLANEVWPDAV